MLSGGMNADARFPDAGGPDRAESYGERALGILLDRAHTMPPESIPPLVAEEIARMGGREVSLLLGDCEEEVFVPLRSGRPATESRQAIADTDAGRAFLEERTVEVGEPSGTRMYLPLPAGSGPLGVLALTLDRVDDDDRRVLRRLAGLIGNTILAKAPYTDVFTLARRRASMSVAAEIQWSLLPPLSMCVPQVEVAGVLEPVYGIAGDSFDYALNGETLHVAMLDAMGHGLDAAVMATAAVGAYRHARRALVGLSEIYAFMDEVIAEQFGPERFVTAQMMQLDISTGVLHWVNAGHPSPLLIRDGDVVGQLPGSTTLPVGFGGREPLVSEQGLRPGDRVMCFTDGLIEEHATGEAEFGLDQLVRTVSRVSRRRRGVRLTVRELSHTLRAERGGATSDDATLLMIEWRGGPAGRRAPAD